MRLLWLIFCAAGLTPSTGIAQEAFVADQLGEQVMAYRPIQRDSVTDARFEMATNILAETRQASQGDPRKLNAADYWNITSAFVMLDEPVENIGVAFEKAVSTDSATICDYIGAMGAASLERKIPELIIPFQVECSQPSSSAAKFDPALYAHENGLDLGLVQTISEVLENDHRYRATTPVDWSLQRPLDLQNQALVRELYRAHGRYVGRDLVGRRFETAMWAVIQHSDPAMMEEYLPVVQQAVADGQLEATPFKMLIDRVHTIRHGTQVFGSQVGVPLADDQTRSAVKSQYRLE
jgi:hypothetical protein